jgi:hypothetical protein
LENQFDEQLAGQPEGMPSGMPEGQQPTSLGDEILDLLGQNCKNPGEAFVLLQQLCIFVWDQYKIDWTQPEGESASTRKQRYLDYVKQLLDTLKSNKALSQEID